MAVACRSLALRLTALRSRITPRSKIYNLNSGASVTEKRKKKGTAQIPKCSCRISINQSSVEKAIGKENEAPISSADIDLPYSDLSASSPTLPVFLSASLSSVLPSRAPVGQTVAQLGADADRDGWWSRLQMEMCHGRLIPPPPASARTQKGSCDF